MSFIDCCRASCSFISTISHLASSFQNLKHANHLAPHFAHFCVLSGQNLLLSYVESPIVILSYSPFAKQNQTEHWQIFKSFCIEIKVLKESKYKMPLVHCAFAMYYRYLLECQWKILMQILLIAKIWIILSVRFGTLLPNIGKATTRWASWRECSKPKKISGVVDLRPKLAEVWHIWPNDWSFQSRPWLQWCKIFQALSLVFCMLNLSGVWSTAISKRNYWAVCAQYWPSNHERWRVKYDHTEVITTTSTPHSGIW